MTVDAIYEYPEFERASGEVECELCQQPYRKHPHAMEWLCQGEPWLRRLCDGRLVKL